MLQMFKTKISPANYVHHFTSVKYSVFNS